MHEANRPRVDDLVWVQGKNPRWYAYYIGWWPGWGSQDSRANGEVIHIVNDDVIVQLYDGHGQETYDRHQFSHKEDHVWKLWIYE